MELRNIAAEFPVPHQVILNKERTREMPRPFVFPLPTKARVKDRSVLCSADRVLSLFNQQSGRSAKRISKAGKKWFVGESKRAGWSGCHFLPEIQSSHSAGCILFTAPKRVGIQISVSETVLVLRAETGDEN